MRANANPNLPKKHLENIFRRNDYALVFRKILLTQHCLALLGATMQNNVRISLETVSKAIIEARAVNICIFRYLS